MLRPGRRYCQERLSGAALRLWVVLFAKLTAAGCCFTNRQLSVKIGCRLV